MKPSSKKPKALVVIGPPGSGKGTQAHLLCRKFGLKHLGSGDILRARQKKGDFTGRKLAEIMNKGGLAPSFVVVKILGDELEKIKKEPKLKGVVLDGWTRIDTEAMMADEALEWYGWNENAKVFLIKISKKESLNRLTKRRQCGNCGRLIPWVGHFKKIKKCDQCGGNLKVRIDDKIEVIKNRLEEYKKETVPAINYYKKRGKLIEINGEQPIEAVFREILGKI